MEYRLAGKLRRVIRQSLFLFIGSILSYTVLDAQEQILAQRASSGAPQKVSLVLVGHGGIPSDFPKIKEYFQLQKKGGEEFEQIEHELVYWPRNEENDPYWKGFMKFVAELKKSGAYYSVYPAFNEFSAPTVNDALTSAIEQQPDVVIVSSIMLTPGGGHAEKDIPASIESFSKKHPSVQIHYAWPYDAKEVSDFLIMHAKKFIQNNQ